MKLIPREIFKVKSKSEKGKFHEVKLVFGQYSCDCIYHQMKHKDCSHIKIIKNKQ